MNVDHSPSAVGGNDDKPIVLTCAFVGVRELTYGRTQGRGSIAAPNQIGLLLGAVIINPLKPVVDGSNGAVWPDRLIGGMWREMMSQSYSTKLGQLWAVACK